ncbi:ABC transporter substrate-binding protein [Actinomyces vulturis]|uniref:ABC transporter substrate-binding protein n=1 Tax=Actinomyces vulturis TaxID=1857645 RepID=UPI0008318732|nr:ABC transporter substrate-binding protein [Actinomyces vulturis]
MATSLPRRRFIQASAATALLATLAACGGSKDHSSDAPASPQSAEFEGTGPITWVQGKDFSGGKVQARLDEWNKENPGEEVTLIELSSEADQQRQSLVNNAQTNSDAYDVISLDNVWVAEFAANQWVMPLPAEELKNNDIIDAVYNTGVYRDVLYGMPFATDAPMMYYRKDLLEQAGVKVPTTWDEVKTAIDAVRKLPGHENIGGFGGQWAKYEGLTCNISEFIHTCGGGFYNDKGDVIINSPESIKGLQTAMDGFKDGIIPQAALEWKEEDGRNAFESDQLLFYRQWPYEYGSDLEALGVEKFGVAPLPSINGNAYVPTLGGHNCAISKDCKNKATALKFIQWWTSKESEEYALKEQSLAPILGELYTEEENVQQFPYLPVLKDSLDDAKGRPRVVNYGDVTAAIQDAIYPAIKGETTAEEAIKDLESKLKAVSA